MQEEMQSATQLYYLMSPYSHPDPGVREERFREALRAAAWLMNHGYIVFSPIAHAHPIAVHHELPKGWEFWKRQDETLVDRSDAGMVLLLAGWRESTGVKAEMARLRNQGKMVQGLKLVGDGYEFCEVPA